jgi:uncharacterized protein (DUF1330 family)
MTNAKSHSAFTHVLLAGLTVGALLTTALWAQSTPPAYVVAEADVHDAEVFGRDYAPKVAGTLEPYGGRVLTSGKLTTLEGNAPPRFVIIGFDSVDKAQAWYQSPAYQALASVRQNAATSSLFIAEGRPK